MKAAAETKRKLGKLCFTSASVLFLNFVVNKSFQDRVFLNWKRDWKRPRELRRYVTHVYNNAYKLLEHSPITIRWPFSHELLSRRRANFSYFQTRSVFWIYTLPGRINFKNFYRLSRIYEEETRGDVYGWVISQSVDIRASGCRLLTGRENYRFRAIPTGCSTDWPCTHPPRITHYSRNCQERRMRVTSHIQCVVQDVLRIGSRGRDWSFNSTTLRCPLSCIWNARLVRQGNFSRPMHLAAICAFFRSVSGYGRNALVCKYRDNDRAKTICTVRQHFLRCNISILILFGWKVFDALLLTFNWESISNFRMFSGF